MITNLLIEDKKKT